jgi:Tfp pilus assembly pilus retraction ATPase PilT
MITAKLEHFTNLDINDRWFLDVKKYKNIFSQPGLKIFSGLPDGEQQLLMQHFIQTLSGTLFISQDKNYNLISEDRSVQFLLKAIEVCDEGGSAIVCANAKNLEALIDRIADLSENRERGLRKISRTLTFCAHTKTLRSADQSRAYSLEILTLSEQTARLIRTDKLHDLVYSSPCKTDLDQSLNQSLFQLLLKRKIDFRTAFEFTNNPEELDNMLKKIGV